MNDLNPPTRKIQIWQLIVAVMALVSLIVFGSYSNYSSNNFGSEYNLKIIDSIEPRKYRTTILRGSSTESMFNENLFITLNENIIRRTFSLVVSSSGNPQKKYRSLSLGDSFVHDGYEIKIFEFKEHFFDKSVVIKVREIQKKEEL